MKFQPDTLAGVNAISRIDTLSHPQQLWIGPAAYSHSLVVPWRGEVLNWQLASFEALTPAHFAQLVALKPEVVIFGSGRRLRFPPAALTRSLIEARIGVESMDTGAAARTYNVLANEGRNAVGAFLLEAA
jgi:uncharacterized protein